MARALEAARHTCIYANFPICNFMQGCIWMWLTNNCTMRLRLWQVDALQQREQGFFTLQARIGMWATLLLLDMLEYENMTADAHQPWKSKASRGR